MLDSPAVLRVGRRGAPAWLLVAALGACSSEVVTTEPSPPPSAPGVKPTARPERVRIIQVTPADGALHVAPLAKVVLLLNGQADPTSISASTVELYGPGSSGEPLAATVSYDAIARTITLTPKAPLGNRACVNLAPHRDGVHRITTQSLRAWNGVPIDDVTTSFTTVYNPWTSEMAYVGGSVLQSATYGWYHTSTQLPDGRTERLIHWGWGPDGVPHTPDDRLLDHDDYSYAGATTRYVHYIDAGPDKVWLTKDDVIGTYDEQSGSDGHYHEVLYKGPGPNGVWFDQDDETFIINDYLLEANGVRPTELRFLGAGADGVPFTADDVIWTYRRYAWSDGTARVFEYHDPGADKAWHTADDVVDQVRDLTLDSLGDVASWANKTAGPDGQWLTPDDTIALLYRCGPSSAGVDLGSQFDGPGPDGVWFTEDDHRRLYFRYTHAPSGALTDQSIYDAPGPDGQWLSGDDHLGDAFDYDASR